MSVDVLYNYLDDVCCRYGRNMHICHATIATPINCTNACCMHMLSITGTHSRKTLLLGMMSMTRTSDYAKQSTPTRQPRTYPELHMVLKQRMQSPAHRQLQPHVDTPTT